MSNPNAVATVEATQNMSVGALPPAVQQQLELRKLSNQVAGKLAEMNWGKQLDLATRRAVADWGQRYHVDVSTEIHVLGGNIYLNAAYYLRRLASLIEAGKVEYAYADHISDDPRLAEAGDDGKREQQRRLMERIKYGVPDKAAAAVAFRVKLKAMEQEIVGVKWCGNGARENDPVGNKFPVEAAESRAARRAVRQLVTHVPEVADEIEILEGVAEDVSEHIQANAAETAKRNKEINAPLKPLPAIDPTDPYHTSNDTTEEQLQDEVERELGL